MTRRTPTLCFAFVLAAALFQVGAHAQTQHPALVPTTQINSGDTAWMITASALVLLMTIPGLALFYAGMVRKKNILATMAQSFAVCALVSLLWFVCGYSLAFMPGSDWIGGWNALPLVYAPVAHWVWEPTGWLAQRGVLDFAGGTVVHVNAGIAGLACAWMLGPRIGFGREPLMPSNLGYTMIGASLLWVGWMGFNGGSACAADGRAGMAMLVTQLAAAAATLSWMLAEWAVRGSPTLLGLCSGAVAGLVAITPIGGASSSVANQAIGIVATLCYSGLVTLLILWVLDQMVGLRASAQQETEGLDLSQHGERVE